MISATRVLSVRTRRVLTAGSVLSSLLFLGAILLETVTPGDAQAAQLADPVSWAWAGIVVLLVTPVLGLFATIAEYRHPDARTSLLAVGVLALLGLSAFVSLLR